MSSVVRMRSNTRAKLLRRSATDAESLLWWMLRDRRLNGWKFRRQHPVGTYIVDFVCVMAALVVEVDGGQHLEQQAFDRRRTVYLQGRGFHVIRFWNHDVLLHTDAVLEMILRNLKVRHRKG